MSEDSELAATVKRLVERVQLLEDVLALNRLRHDLHRFVNNDDWARVGELFSPDAVLDYGHLGQASGRDAIQRYFAGLPDVVAQRKPGASVLLKQFTHGHDVEVAGERATGVSFFEERVVLGDESFVSAGRFSDRYVREGDRWLYSRIELDLYWVLPQGSAALHEE